LLVTGRLELLRRYLGDDNIPTRARVAAVLLLLYAQPLSRIRQPRRPGTQLPQDPIDNLTVLTPPPWPAARLRQQRLDHRPRLIRQLTATHTRHINQN
jgi:hypothetical protein